MSSNSLCYSSCNATPFNCKSQDQVGNILLSRFYELDRKGALHGNTANGVVSTIVAYGISTASTTCTESFEGDQTIDLECNNPVIGNLVRNNKNCKNCREQVATLIQEREYLEEKAHQLNPNYQKQVPSPALLDQLKGPQGDYTNGICAYVCDQCVIKDVSQTLQLNMTEKCEVKTRNFRNAFVSGMIDQAAAEITRHQDALNATGANIQTQDNVKSLAVHVANSIQQITNTKVLTQIHTQALTVQSMVIAPDSTSVVLQNVKQNMTVNMVASMVSKMYTDTQMKSSIDFSDHEEEVALQTSFLDLLKDIELSVEKMSQLLLQTVGKVMITIVAILMIMVMIFAGVFFAKPSVLFGGVFSDEDSSPGLNE